MALTCGMAEFQARHLLALPGNGRRHMAKNVFQGGAGTAGRAVLRKQSASC